jgi:hypothetical protein
MNNKLQIYAFATTSLCSFLFGIVVAQNLGNPMETKELQASLIPSSLSTSQLPSVSSLATSDNLSKAQAAASKIIPTSVNTQTLTNSASAAVNNATSGIKDTASGAAAKLETTSSSLTSASLPSNINLQSLKIPTGTGSTIPNIQSATNQLSNVKIPVATSSSTDELKKQFPGLTGEQQAILTKRLATAKDTMCPNTGECQKPADTVENLAGPLKVTSNPGNSAGLPDSLKELTGGLSGLAGGLDINSLKGMATNALGAATGAAKSAAMGAATNAAKSVGGSLGF